MSTTEDFLREHPLCWLCGGTEPATTIDSQPPKIVFPNKAPEIEFPTCASCQNQTSADEAVLAVVCRYISGPRRDRPSDLSPREGCSPRCGNGFPASSKGWIKVRLGLSKAGD